MTIASSNGDIGVSAGKASNVEAEQEASPGSALPSAFCRLTAPGRARVGALTALEREKSVRSSFVFFPLVLCSLMLPVGSASAEGRCPPGQYPVGGPGIQGCAPIASGSSTPTQPSIPRPSGSWSLTWGSIFVSASTGATGVAVGKPTKRDAIAEAQAYCSSKGAKDCVEEITYENSCVALAD